MVIDADALNALGQHPPHADDPRVLTPHLGEMARLTGVPADVIEGTRIEAAREWAQTWDAVLVLKGAPSVTASTQGRATVNPTGNPGMATLGTGDVLAGLIGAMIAQGLGAYDAARLGAFLHGAAGDHAALSLGHHGLAAGDLVEALPQAILQLVRLRDETPARRGRAGRS
jgi:NAD(P)H-hydrate epimerase